MKDTKQIFQKDYEIHSYEVLKDQRLNPVRLVDYLNDIAGQHSESLGYSMKDLFEKDCSWIVLSWNLCISRLPYLRSKIHIETWVSQVKRSFAYREFLLKDDNEIFCKASSLWLFYHITKHRPVKIPLELVNLWILNREISCPESIIESDLFERKDFIYEEFDYTVEKQDIDILNHVHNSRYIGWIINSKPDHLKKDYSLKHLQISYHHEIKYPAQVIVQQKIFPRLNRRQYFIKDEICDREKEIIFSEVVTQWDLSE
ncbi:MAG TPA: thioesterase [Atribacterota bacterium]|nr:thioesterase [Atribacterota bacterium]